VRNTRVRGKGAEGEIGGGCWGYDRAGMGDGREGGEGCSGGLTGEGEVMPPTPAPNPPPPPPPLPP